jgi:hypothetical protein
MAQVAAPPCSAPGLPGYAASTDDATVRAARVTGGPHGQARLSGERGQNLPASMAPSVTRETW